MRFGPLLCLYAAAAAPAAASPAPPAPAPLAPTALRSLGKNLDDIHRRPGDLDMFYDGVTLWSCPKDTSEWNTEFKEPVPPADKNGTIVFHFDVFPGYMSSPSRDWFLTVLGANRDGALGVECAFRQLVFDNPVEYLHKDWIVHTEAQPGEPRNAYENGSAVIREPGPLAMYIPVRLDSREPYTLKGQVECSNSNGTPPHIRGGGYAFQIHMLPFETLVEHPKLLKPPECGDASIEGFIAPGETLVIRVNAQTVSEVEFTGVYYWRTAFKASDGDEVSAVIMRWYTQGENLVMRYRMECEGGGGNPAVTPSAIPTPAEEDLDLKSTENVHLSGTASSSTEHLSGTASSSTEHLSGTASSSTERDVMASCPAAAPPTTPSTVSSIVEAASSTVDTTAAVPSSASGPKTVTMTVQTTGPLEDTLNDPSSTVSDCVSDSVRSCTVTVFTTIVVGSSSAAETSRSVSAPPVETTSVKSSSPAASDSTAVSGKEATSTSSKSQSRAAELDPEIFSPTSTGSNTDLSIYPQSSEAASIPTTPSLRLSTSDTVPVSDSTVLLASGTASSGLEEASSTTSSLPAGLSSGVLTPVFGSRSVESGSAAPATAISATGSAASTPALSSSSSTGPAAEALTGSSVVPSSNVAKSLSPGPSPAVTTSQPSSFVSGSVGQGSASSAAGSGLMPEPSSTGLPSAAGTTTTASASGITAGSGSSSAAASVTDTASLPTASSRSVLPVATSEGSIVESADTSSSSAPRPSSAVVSSSGVAESGAAAVKVSSSVSPIGSAASLGSSTSSGPGAVSGSGAPSSPDATASESSSATMSSTAVNLGTTTSLAPSTIAGPVGGVSSGTASSSSTKKSSPSETLIFVTATTTLSITHPGGPSTSKATSTSTETKSGPVTTDTDIYIHIVHGTTVSHNTTAIAWIYSEDPSAAPPQSVTSPLKVGGDTWVMAGCVVGDPGSKNWGFWEKSEDVIPPITVTECLRTCKEGHIALVDGNSCWCTPTDGPSSEFYDSVKADSDCKGPCRSEDPRDCRVGDVIDAIAIPDTSRTIKAIKGDAVDGKVEADARQMERTAMIFKSYPGLTEYEAKRVHRPFEHREIPLHFPSRRDGSARKAPSLDADDSETHNAGLLLRLGRWFWRRLLA